jgi:hypothetical protein
MGWRLAEAVLDHCPDVSYREFRLLIALALDAKDATRLAMPGHERLALQCNCGIRSVRRAMTGLTDGGLVKVVSHSAPGRRAVYEILLAPVDNSAGNPDTGQHADLRTPDAARQRRTLLRLTQDAEVSPPLSVPSVIDRARPALIKVVTDEIRRATGRTIGPRWAERTITNLLNGQAPDHPAAYLRAAIRRERDPRTRFLSHYGNEDQS